MKNKGLLYIKAFHGDCSGSIQVSGDVSTLAWVRVRVWVQAGLGLELDLGEGWVDTPSESWSDPLFIVWTDPVTQQCGRVWGTVCTGFI